MNQNTCVNIQKPRTDEKTTLGADLWQYRGMGRLLIANP